MAHWLSTPHPWLWAVGAVIFSVALVRWLRSNLMCSLFTGVILGAVAYVTVAIAVINNEPAYDCNLVGECHDWSVK